MKNWSKKILVLGAAFAASMVGCSNDSEDSSGDGDGDENGNGSVVTGSGGSSSGGDGDGNGGRDVTLDPCFGDLVYCTNGCADLTSDDEHCGSCNNDCDSGQMCDEGECVADPSAGGAGPGGAGGAGGVGGASD